LRFNARSTSPKAHTDASEAQAPRRVVLSRSSVMPAFGSHHSVTTSRSLPPNQYVVTRQLSSEEEKSALLQRVQASPFQEDKITYTPQSASRMNADLAFSRCLSLLDSATRHLPSATLPH
jgi:hypothetical protein